MGDRPQPLPPGTDPTHPRLVAEPEPWLCGSHADTPAVARALVHALEQAQQDLKRWCRDLTDNEVNATPYGLPPIAFHLRHIARSIDRLLTYSEGMQLSAQQLNALQTEREGSATRDGLLEEVTRSIDNASDRVRRIGAGITGGAEWEAPRTVGSRQLPTTLAGLVIHVAEHTQRHVGEMLTTAKILLARRNE